MILKERILDLLVEGKFTQRELSIKLKASRSRISEVLSELEKDGFIKREKISDRTVIVSIDRNNLLRVGILKSSEYAPIIITLNKINKNIVWRIKVYDNSLEALRDLVIGELDLVASPTISAYFFNLIDENIKPVLGIARGGSGLLRRKNYGILGTTPLSRMDRDSREIAGYKLKYFKNIESIISSYMNFEIDAASVWEPFVTKYGGELNRKNEICCSIITSREMWKSLETFLIEYKKSIMEMADPSKRKEAANQLSKIIGEDENLIYESFDSYTFSYAIDPEDVRKQLDAMRIPESGKMDEFLRRYNELSL